MNSSKLKRETLQSNYMLTKAKLLLYYGMWMQFQNSSVRAELDVKSSAVFYGILYISLLYNP
jgi:hypothetical protein